MTAYYFFARRADGVSITMDIDDLASDAEAQAHAEAMLSWNQAAAEVEIWRDVILVGARLRDDGRGGAA